MAKKMLIDATHAEETRVVVVDGNKVDEFDFESENKRQLAGNIYLAKVTRVEPSLQAAFIDYGGNRHGFLAFSEIHPDYYQIPVADREALLAEELAYAESLAAQEDEAPKKRRNRRSRTKAKAEKTVTDDLVAAEDAPESSIPGMDVVDLDGDVQADVDADNAPVDQEADAPAETPDASAEQDDGGDVALAPESDDASAAAATEDTADGAATTEAGKADEDENFDAIESAADRDDSIESVADEDESEDIRPKRKPRPRRYKIQEVVKVRQILLVQVVKEERGNKGAALTTYLSLAGRYCVLMPNTARGGGISRKITNAADRKKLKEIANEIDVPKGAGLIVRTAGAKRTKTEIKRDYEYLQRMWEQIRELTLKSIAPAKIYEEGNLIKRSIRDLYNKDIDEVFVEGEAGYRVAKDFMKMIMPSHAKNVKHYAEQMPLFARYQVESYLGSMFNPTVQLRSGGYIVIGVTEALVAIDVNSGRATKEGSIEETALKTNLEASEEVARQLRLRDLAGLIVIDFIDMEERKNNAAVEKRLKDKLKTDRARIQVGRISGFGLLEMSRQRLRPGMLEATTQPCPSCHGTGLLRSDDSLGLTILRQLEEEGTRRRSREVLIKVPVSIINFLMNQKREHVAQIEARYGMAVRIEADPHLVSPDYSLEKFKTATRVVDVATAPVVSVDASLMPEIDEIEETAEATPEATDQQPRKKRRRRRRRGKGGGTGPDAQAQDATPAAAEADGEPVNDNAPAPAETSGDEAGEAASGADDVAAEDAPKPKRRSRSRRKKTEEPVADAETVDAAPEQSKAAAETEAPATEPAAEEPPKPKRRTRTRKKADAAEAEVAVAEEEAAPVKKPRRSRAKKNGDATGGKQDAAPPAPEVAAGPADNAPAADAVVPDPQPDAPKRRGWWSIGR
jgi:ribonuclease E